MDELWDVKTVARYLKLTERTIYDKTRKGELPALRVGGRWRFRSGDVEAWLDAQGRSGGARVTTGSRGGHTLTPALAAGTAHESGPPPDRQRLEAALGVIDEPLKRRLVFVALLTEACVARGWQPPIIVGGHALEVYTGGAYTTVDIDLVAMSEPLEEILGDWGFAKSGRHWVDDTLGLVVEAPGSRLDAGERAHLTSIATAAGTAYVIGLEDLIVDRLGSCVHWGVQDDCAYAEALIRENIDRLDMVYLRERADREKVAQRLSDIEGSAP